MVPYKVINKKGQLSRVVETATSTLLPSDMRAGRLSKFLAGWMSQNSSTSLQPAIQIFRYNK